MLTVIYKLSHKHTIGNQTVQWIYIHRKWSVAEPAPILPCVTGTHIKNIRAGRTFPCSLFVLSSDRSVSNASLSLLFPLDWQKAPFLFLSSFSPTSSYSIHFHFPQFHGYRVQCAAMSCWSCEKKFCGFFFRVLLTPNALLLDSSVLHKPLLFSYFRHQWISRTVRAPSAIVRPGYHSSPSVRRHPHSTRAFLQSSLRNHLSLYFRLLISLSLYRENVFSFKQIPSDFYVDFTSKWLQRLFILRIWTELQEEERRI